MANEEFHNYATDLISPLDDFYIVANPGDMNAALPQNNGKDVISRAVYVGTAGNLEVVTKDGRTVIIPNLAAGIWHAMRISRINSAGTAAADILVGW